MTWWARWDWVFWSVVALALVVILTVIVRATWMDFVRGLRPHDPGLRSRDEVEDELWKIDDEMVWGPKDSDWPDRTYEEGAGNALRWVLGEGIKPSDVESAVQGGAAASSSSS